MSKYLKIFFTDLNKTNMPKSPIKLNKIPIGDIDKKIASQISSPEEYKQLKKQTNKVKNLEKQFTKAIKVSNQIDDELRKKEFQYEKFDRGVTEKTLKYAQLISTNCKQALSAYQTTGFMLYRGINNPGKKAFVSYPRSNRYPKDTNEEIHKFVNELMSKHFIATRDNSIFCTSDPSPASGYGKVYIIFPFDDFAFTWSTAYSDMTIKVFENYRSVAALIMSAFDLTEEIHSLRNIINEIVDSISDMPDNSDAPLPLQDIEYKQKLYTGLQTMQMKYNYTEIPDIQQNKQFLNLIKPMEITDWHGTDFNFLKETIEKVIFSLDYVNTKQGSKDILDNWKLTNKDFVEAIKSRHEILIRGKYYAFSRLDYGDVFSKIFLGADHS